MRRRQFLSGIATAAAAGRAAAEPPHPAIHPDAAFFRRALREGRAEPLAARITGLTVPHHLLAADLIARAFHLASGTRVRRVVILTPDHFKRSPVPFAVTRRGFSTVFGLLPAWQEGAGALTAEPSLVAESSLFTHEHGVQSLLPFIAHHFPGTPVLAVACGIRTTLTEWQALADLLAPLLDEGTLLVQSTDFSHYLTARDAAAHDAETLRVLAAGDPSGVLSLQQPQHLDSLAAMWLQMHLQARSHRAAGTVVDNRNAIHYGGSPQASSTTSYITMVWTPDPIPAAALPGEAWFFGGDTHFGRHMAAQLTDPAAAERVTTAVRGITGGRPLILNLEGAFHADPASAARDRFRILMEPEFSLTWLRRLGVSAVVLANNHAGDAGPDGRTTTRRLLEAAGIRCLDHGETLTFPGFRLGAATDLDNTPQPRRGLISRELVDAWRRPDDPLPLFAFFHAGEEYRAATTRRQHELCAMAEAAGAVLVTGCHPHRPSPGWERTPRSLRLPSLGNLLFDQRDPAAAGTLLETRFFSQGTWAARRHGMGNLYAGSA